MAERELMAPEAADTGDLVAKIDAIASRMSELKRAVGNVIYGQESVIEQSIATLLSGGHAVLVGVPGLGKTRLVETLGTVFGLDEKRIQFTPDLMPADILGSEILDESDAGERHFRFVEGPVFAQLLMADEINRASPRTQSALLQAMQERRVSVAGRYRDLPQPFHVLATQNPIEQEGTYPLPEAQLDRFLMEIRVPYPDLATERRILLETTGVDEASATRIIDPEALMEAQSTIRRMPVGETIADGILSLVRNMRPEETEFDDVREAVSWGPGPRGTQALMLTIRARAAMEGRLAPSMDDVVELAKPVLRHRMALTFSARADGETIDAIISRMLERIA